MSTRSALKDLNTHFKFGENWSNFSQTIDNERIEHAKQAFLNIFGVDGLKGKTFLDIGCGSGLSSLSASMLGVKQLLATDLDPKSVETTSNLLNNHEISIPYQCKTLSVFELDPKKQGKFDIVYSWGVLHHTGDMINAINQAAKMVNDDGLFMVALYRKTPRCEFWKKEKKFYSKASKIVQFLMKSIYVFLFSLANIISGTNPFKFIKQYKKNRGMAYLHDVHDWLGGYPYESISREEMHKLASELGFYIAKENLIQGYASGNFSSCCDEYLLKKIKYPL
jgi:2-polyprenyl-6-hydroxyphenyl methylase/3-demethylubiquinone-9 3-methyltransferase